MSDRNSPDLSVVIVTPDYYETIRRTIRHLRAQTVKKQLEIVIVAPSADELNLDDSELEDFLWLYHNYLMTYAPEVLIYHAHALTFRTFWLQHFNYGRGAFRFHKARSRRGSGRFKPEVKFYLNLMRYPFSQAWGLRALLLSALLIASQVANAAGFFVGKDESNHR